MMENQNTPQKHTETFKFSGDGGDYFGIWFVNNILSVLTLGIYSAWAKVRTLQYFYGNTEIGGGRFQFTANPLIILRSRIIAVALLALYMVVNNVQSTLSTIILITLIAAYFIFAPILTIFAMSFRLRYSEWRGISFRFNKDYAGAYRVYLAPILLLGLISASFLLPVYSSKVEDFLGMERFEYLSEEEMPESNEAEYSETDSEYYSDQSVDDEYTEEDYQHEEYQEEEYSEESYSEESQLEDDENSESEEAPYVNPYLFIPSGILILVFLALLPYFDFINTRFIARNVNLGTAPFSFVATARDYYRFYSVWLAATFLLIALWTGEMMTDFASELGLLWILGIATIFYIPASRAYLKSRRYNVLLSNTFIDNKHRLQATTPFGGMLWLVISNTLVIIFSFGFMIPWTHIRTARFLLKYSSLEVEGSLDDFIAQQQPESHALAEEVADIFDFDIVG